MASQPTPCRFTRVEFNSRPYEGKPIGFHTPLGYRSLVMFSLEGSGLWRSGWPRFTPSFGMFSFLDGKWQAFFFGREVMAWELIFYLICLATNVPTWWICHVGQQICGALTVFQKAAIFEDICHLKTGGFRAVQCSRDLLCAWHFCSLGVGYRYDVCPDLNGGFCSVLGKSLVFFASEGQSSPRKFTNVSCKKGTISKGKDRLLSGIFFPRDIRSFSGKCPFFVCFLEFFIEYSPEVQKDLQKRSLPFGKAYFQGRKC